MSSYFATSLLPSGNRLVTDAYCAGMEMSARLLNQVEIQTTEELVGADLGVSWIVGTPSSPDPTPNFWMVLDNGDQHGLDGEGNVTNWTAAATSDRPLVIAAASNSSDYIPLEQPTQTSPWSAAVPTPDGGYLLVEELTSGYQLTQLAPNRTDVSHASLRAIANPLPDAMIAFSSNRTQWALYTGATDIYNHAVLGDDLEGSALTVLGWNEETQLVEFHSQVTLEGEPHSDTAFEGLGPIWADVDGDGKDDLVTTISNSAVGARLRVYSPTTTETAREADNLVMMAQAEAINLGGRWLHQLAVGPLGPNGETEIVEIRTPHIGGIVRYYQYDAEAPVEKNNLKLVASTSRYTSHEIRSRRLDTAVVGDFNGDGIPELVVQGQGKDVLVALQRSEKAEIETIWSIPLSSPVESNLAVSCMAETGMMEILFCTRSHQLIKAQFVPTDIDVERGLPHNDNGLENQPLDASSDSSPVIMTGGASSCWMGPWTGSPLYLGLHMVLLLRLARAF